MSPIRKVDDLRSVEIESWDDYIQEEITGMHARGELDNLPHQGKPIKIWRTELNPEYDLAFSRLKNAGVLPLWMELDKEIVARTEALWSGLETVEAGLRGLIAQFQAPVSPEPVAQRTLWQRFTGWFRTDFASNAPPPPTMASIIATRERERTRFLALAAELDKVIVAYHNSLPRGAEHLQRMRWLPNRAESIFDDRIVLGDWWGTDSP